MKEKDCEISEIANDNLEDKTQLRVKVLGGYDGFGGTHDNLKCPPKLPNGNKID